MIDNWGEPTDAAKQKDAMIRELEQAVAFADDNRTFQIERAEKAEALICDLEHQVERLRHFEQVHIDNLDMYRAQIAEKDALIRELVAALEPFSGEKLPPLKKTERDYDRNGLRCMMSPMEIATKQAALIIAKAKAAGFEP